MSTRKRNSLQERLARHADEAPVPVSTSVRADDALKYAAAILKDRIGWTTEAIACSEECGDDVHENELAAISDVVRQIRALAARFGDPHRYSDGRQIETYVNITRGLSYGHIWHPDSAEEKPGSQSGEVPSGDPDLPSPGRWEIKTDPSTQKIYGRVVRTV